MRVTPEGDRSDVRSGATEAPPEPRVIRYLPHRAGAARQSPPSGPLTTTSILSSVARWRILTATRPPNKVGMSLRICDNQLKKNGFHQLETKRRRGAIRPSSNTSPTPMNPARSAWMRTHPSVGECGHQNRLSLAEVERHSLGQLHARPLGNRRLHRSQQLVERAWPLLEQRLEAGELVHVADGEGARTDASQLLHACAASQRRSEVFGERADIGPLGTHNFHLDLLPSARTTSKR